MLFGHVRLVFVSRDFLSSDILKNDLVRNNECCLNRVVDAINLIDAQNYGNLSISPRKSLETFVIVVTSAMRNDISPNWELSAQPILCYFPGEGRWCKLGEMPCEYSGKGEFVFYRSKLYSKVLDSFRQWSELRRALACYNPYSNCWTRLPYIDVNRGALREIFVCNDNEMYALVSEMRAVEYRRDRWSREGNNDREICVSSIRKYKVESNSWEDVTSFDHLNRRENFCIVAKDNFVYFIGGEEILERNGKELLKCYTDVYRYNLSRNQWDKVADFLRPKKFVSGAACNERVFITGGLQLVTAGVTVMSPRCECEVYSETTNEWQSIAILNIRPEARPKLCPVGEQLYALGSYMSNVESLPSHTRVECYDPDKDEWILKTELPFRTRSNVERTVNSYLARIFKGFLSNQQSKSHNPWRFFRPVQSSEASEGKFVIM